MKNAQIKHLMILTIYMKLNNSQKKKNQRNDILHCDKFKRVVNRGNDIVMIFF